MKQYKLREYNYTFMKQDNDYISLTDIARFKDRERTEYIVQLDEKSRHHRVLGIWEHLNNKF